MLLNNHPPQISLLPPHRIKPGIIKQFMKALSKERECFEYLRYKLSAVSDTKIEEGVFVCLDIRKVMKDYKLDAKMNVK